MEQKIRRLEKMAGTEELQEMAFRNECANSYAPANGRLACGGSHDKIAAPPLSKKMGQPGDRKPTQKTTDEELR